MDADAPMFFGVPYYRQIQITGDIGILHIDCMIICALPNIAGPLDKDDEVWPAAPMGRRDRC